jgi:hypothetical protein
MTELQFYKLFNEQLKCEYHWNGEQCLVFIDYWKLEDFFKAFKGSTLLTDEGQECVMKDGYIAIDIVPFCEYYDVEAENIFEKEQA